MTIKIKPNTVFVFDLDDTLFKELDYLKSAYKEIAALISATDTDEVYQEMLNYYQEGKNAFAEILNTHQSTFTTKDLLNVYRNHQPKISFTSGVQKTLSSLKEHKVVMGIITDGRSKQQRSKINALCIEQYTSDIIISEEFGTEKPDERNYTFFHKKYPNSEYIYFGDNVRKDFVSPNKLGWKTICLLDDGNNIHKQSFDWDDVHLPQHKIKSFNDLNLIYER